jgi:hypothetical protein
MTKTRPAQSMPGLFKKYFKKLKRENQEALPEK